MPQRFFSYIHPGRILFCFLLAVALLPILVIPGVDSNPSLIKPVMVAVLVGALTIFFGAGTLTRGHAIIEIPRGFIYLFPLLFGLIVSALFSGSAASGLWGISFDVGTVGFYVVFLVVVYVAAQAGQANLVRALKVFSIGVIAAALSLFVAFYIFEGSGLLSKVAGEWPQLSFLLGAVVFSGLIIRSHTNNTTPGFPVLGTLLFALVALFFFPYPPAYYAIGIALLFSLFRLFVYGEWQVQPIRVIVGIFLALALLLFFAFRFGIAERLPAEVHPTLLLTELVATPAVTESIKTVVFGVGPSQFGSAWLAYYPVEINQTSLWNEMFTSGQSFLLTRTIETGALGLIGIICLAYIGTRFFSLNYAYITALVFFLVSAASFPVDAPFLLWGALVFGFLLRDDHPYRYERKGYISVVAGIVLVITGSIIFGIAYQQMVSLHAHEKGVALYDSGDRVSAAIYFEKASERWPAALYLRDSARVMLELGLSSANFTPEQQQELLGRSIGRIDQAIRNAPRDFNSWLVRASIYVSLVSVGSTEGEGDARQSIEQAKSLARNRPDPYYLEAMLERNLQNTEAARGALQAALTLKPDYVEAHQLLEIL